MMTAAMNVLDVPRAPMKDLLVLPTVYNLYDLILPVDICSGILGLWLGSR